MKPGEVFHKQLFNTCCCPDALKTPVARKIFSGAALWFDPPWQTLVIATQSLGSSVEPRLLAEDTSQQALSQDAGNHGRGHVKWLFSDKLPALTGASLQKHLNWKQLRSTAPTHQLAGNVQQVDLWSLRYDTGRFA